MRYLSDIHLILRKKDAEYLKNELPLQFAEKYSEEPNYIPFFSYQPDKVKNLDGGNYIYCCWRSYRFYGDLPDVQFFRKWLKEVDHHFIRIGEVNDDIEENKWHYNGPKMVPIAGIEIWEDGKVHRYM